MRGLQGLKPRWMESVAGAREKTALWGLISSPRCACRRRHAPTAVSSPGSTRRRGRRSVCLAGRAVSTVAFCVVEALRDAAVHSLPAPTGFPRVHRECHLPFVPPCSPAVAEVRALGTEVPTGPAPRLRGLLQQLLLGWGLSSALGTTEQPSCDRGKAAHLLPPPLPDLRRRKEQCAGPALQGCCRTRHEHKL